jgi:hypothetical protein
VATQSEIGLLTPPQMAYTFARMNRLIRYVTPIAIACLIASCSSDPLAGIYRGPLSEAVKIEHDGEVLWQPPKKISSNHDNFRVLGILSQSHSTGTRQLLLPSSSPYIGTALSIFDDQKVILVDWQSRRTSGVADTRSVHYTKE